MNKHKKDITNIRIDYSKLKIDFTKVPDNPISLFEDWFDEIFTLNKHQSITCILSTISLVNTPDSRVILLRGINDKGFIFFTNYNSSKAKQIDINPIVSLIFYWQDLERQVRIIGDIKKISTTQSDIYFDNRPRTSQIGAWISNQSEIISFDVDFQEKLKKFENRFKNKKVLRPLNWGGYLVVPKEIEFWQGRPSRLHDRLRYKRINQEWEKNRLSP